MRPRPIAVFVCLPLAALAACGRPKPAAQSAAVPDAAVAESIRVALRAYAARGANRLDTAYLATRYAHDRPVSIFVNTTAYDSPGTFLKAAAARFAAYDSARVGLNSEEVTVLAPGAAVARAAFTAALYPRRGLMETRAGLWTTVWEREAEGSWRIVHEHVSEARIAKPAHLRALTGP